VKTSLLQEGGKGEGKYWEGEKKRRELKREGGRGTIYSRRRFIVLNKREEGRGFPSDGDGNQRSSVGKKRKSEGKREDPRALKVW